MIKTMLFSNNDGIRFQCSINDFIKDKKVISIQYQSFIIPKQFTNGIPTTIEIVDRALVLYEED